MLFTNNQIELDNLPKVEGQPFVPLKLKYRSLILIQWTVFLLFPLTAILVAYYFEPEFTPEALIYALVGLGLFYSLRILMVYMGFKRKGYVLREHDILYKTGLLVQKIVAIPYNRIQHSEIRQGFFSRMFKIAKLKIFTAGGATSDLSINGISPEDAQEIKDFLSKTVSKYE